MREELTPSNPEAIVPEAPDADAGAEAAPAEEISPVRAMYARLAREYEKRPTVPDCRGGVVGDRYPF